MTFESLEWLNQKSDYHLVLNPACVPKIAVSKMQDVLNFLFVTAAPKICQCTISKYTENHLSLLERSK